MGSPLADFSKLVVRELPKSQTVYHATDGEPVISTEKRRLVPRSLSAALKPLPDWGSKAYALRLPAGARVGELNSIWDLLREGDEVTPMDLGKLLRKYATKNKLDALKIGQVPGVGTEFAVLNPDYLQGSKKLR